MADLYPPPPYAAYIWTAGDQIKLELPSPHEGVKAHSVTFPNSPAGWMAVSMILRDRERAIREATIGTKASPVQYDVEGMLRKIGAAKVQVIPAVRKIEASLDLSLEDLDL